MTKISNTVVSFLTIEGHEALRASAENEIAGVQPAPDTVDADKSRSSDMAHEVLARLAGDWDIVFNESDPFSKGTLSGKWVLGDKYLEQSCELKAGLFPDDVKLKILATYDEDSKKFKRWCFASNGRDFTSSGTWNPEAETMIWVTEQVAPDSKLIVTETTIAFKNENTIEVTSVSTDDSGREVGRMTERRTRRK